MDIWHLRRLSTSFLGIPSNISLVSYWVVNTVVLCIEFNKLTSCWKLLSLVSQVARHTLRWDRWSPVPRWFAAKTRLSKHGGISYLPLMWLFPFMKWYMIYISLSRPNNWDSATAMRRSVLTEAQKDKRKQRNAYEYFCFLLVAIQKTGLVVKNRKCSAGRMSGPTSPNLTDKKLQDKGLSWTYYLWEGNKKW